MFSVKFLTAIFVLLAVECAQSVNLEGNLARSFPRNLARSQLNIYPIPTGMNNNTAFTVKVRSPGGSWMPLDAYLVNLNQINTTTGAGEVQKSSMVYFDFQGSVEVSVTYNKGPITSAVIRPYSYGLVPQPQGHSTLEFTLMEPRNLIVQVNDNIFDCLHLLSNTIETNAPTGNSTDVIYFGPGVHTVPGGVLQVPSGKTVYLAGGAVLTANVNFSNVHDASMRGRGVLYNNPGGAITVEYSSNITIEGAITALDPNGYAVIAGQVDGLTIRGLHAFSNKGNGDGIDLFSCQNVLIDSVFMRNSDDCIALYNHRWNYYGNSSNITVQNSSLWADVAHPVNIGTHGNTDSPETMDGVTIKNIDILDHREPQMLYQGCIAINPGDSNVIQNVNIDDIRVEDFRIGQLINMRVMYNTKYNTSPGRRISNVTIKNMNYTGTHANPSILEGYDSGRSIDFITFENLVINGNQIADTMKKPTWYLTSDFVPMFANDHVNNLTFLAT